MEAIQAFLKKKDVEISTKRYLIDAMGAMAQGLFLFLAHRDHHQCHGPSF